MWFMQKAVKSPVVNSSIYKDTTCKAITPKLERFKVH